MHARPQYPVHFDRHHRLMTRVPDVVATQVATTIDVHTLNVHTPDIHHNDTTTRVEIRLLGGFEVVVDGTRSPADGWSRRHAAALVKILALAPGHRVHREKVMDLLWPDLSPAESAPRLHKAAHYARRAAGHPDAVVLRNDMVHLFPDALLTIDTVEFERAAKAAVADEDPARARAALAWYRGELLPADRYEEWAVDRREVLHLRRLDLLRVAEEWRDLTALEPADEEARVQLMRAHLDAGDGEAARREYAHLQQVLERDLGVTPGAAARQARRDAERVTAPRPLAPAITTPDLASLLAELSELVSRQGELLAELAAVGLAPDATSALVA